MPSTAGDAQHSLDLQGGKIKKPLVISERNIYIYKQGREGLQPTEKTNGVSLQNAENSSGKGHCRRVRLSKNVLVQGWAGASKDGLLSGPGPETADTGEHPAQTISEKLGGFLEQT